MKLFRTSLYRCTSITAGLKFISFVILLPLSTACTETEFGAKSAGNSGKAKTSQDSRSEHDTASQGGDERSGPATEFDTMRVDPKIVQDNESLKNMPLNKFFDLIISQVSDNAFTLAGYTFVDLRTTLEDQRDRMLALEDEYPTLGDLVVAQEVEAVDVNQEFMATLAENADSVINTGGAGLNLLGRCGAMEAAQKVCYDAEGPAGLACAAAYRSGNAYAMGATCGGAALAYACAWSTQIAIGGYCSDDPQKPAPAPGQTKVNEKPESSGDDENKGDDQNGDNHEPMD